jgi:hypothetical protein
LDSLVKLDSTYGVPVADAAAMILITAATAQAAATLRVLLIVLKPGQQLKYLLAKAAVQVDPVPEAVVDITEKVELALVEAQAETQAQLAGQAAEAVEAEPL